MPNYQRLYFMLFNAITDSLAQIEAANYGLAREILMQVQCEAEERCISEPDAPAQ